MAKRIFEISDLKSQIGSLRGKYRHQWVESSFDLNRDEDGRIGTAHTERYLGFGISPRALRRFFIVALAIFVLVFIRLFWLQIIKGDDYRFLAENNRVRLRTIPAPRGIFYDRHGRELVHNVPNLSLVIIPQDLPTSAAARQRVIAAAALLSSSTPESIYDVIEKYRYYSYESLTIKENIDYDAALNFYVANESLPGLAVQSNTKRSYFDNRESSWSHILGYLGKISPADWPSFIEQGYQPSDNIGVAGLEKNYENELRGVYGKKKIETDALGKELSVLSEEAPLSGKNLYLAIDAEAQQKLEELLSARLALLRQTRGAAVALDPNNGEIVAMVSLPAFNNNDFSGGIAVEQYQKYLNNDGKPLFNRVISGLYPSGSIIKPLVAAAALQENIIKENTRILSTGGLQIDRWFFPDWKAGGHGPTDVRAALAWSINTFFYYVGGGYRDFVGLGPDLLYRYLTKFGLGEKSGVDVPSEQTGLIPTPQWKEVTRAEPWYIGDTYNLSIGQGDILVTPLQAAVWTAAIANGGRVVRPHVVNKIVNPNTKEEVMVGDQTRDDNFIDPYNIGVVKQGMRQCVTAGSCAMLQSLNFTSAGKTGTAQWSNAKNNHAWFTAFAPYDNPQIVVTVLIEEGGEGGVNAIPIARDWLNWWGKKYLQ